MLLSVCQRTHEKDLLLFVKLFPFPLSSTCFSLGIINLSRSRQKVQTRLNDLIHFPHTVPVSVVLEHTVSLNICVCFLVFQAKSSGGFLIFRNVLYLYLSHVPTTKVELAAVKCRKISTSFLVKTSNTNQRVHQQFSIGATKTQLSHTLPVRQ